MLKSCFENVREKMPLVHNITNYVTVNDVANVLLACGGSPIMSDDIDDVEDITSICGGLNINIGTLNKKHDSIDVCRRKKRQMNWGMSYCWTRLAQAQADFGQKQRCSC